MKSILYPSINVIVIFSTLFISSLLAEEINLSDETIAKELLLNKKLDCQMHEQNYDGIEIIKVVNIKGKKFTGHSDIWCWGKGTTYKGKLKKNSLKWSQQEHSGCYCRTGNLNFFKDDNGLLKAEGNYGTGCGGNIHLGTIKCVVKDN